jgi:hypothetical protein
LRKSNSKIEKVTTRLEGNAASELAGIEAHLLADPRTAPMLRAYNGKNSRGQVVRWAISRAWASLQAEMARG